MSPKRNGIPKKLKYVDAVEWLEKEIQLENSVSKLGPESVEVNCQNCHSNVQMITEPSQKKGCLARWAICCFPCFMKEYQNVAILALIADH